MKKLSTNTILIIIILLLMAGMFGIAYYYNKKLDKSDAKYKLEVLRADKLERINDTQYRKLVADSLSKRDLAKIIDSLEFELDNVEPITVTEIQLVPEYIEKPIDSISVKDSIVSIVDFYPKNDENYFLKYSNQFSLRTNKGIGKFEFQPIDISIVLSQREDGIFQSDIKVPPFLTVGKVDIQSRPLEDNAEKDNFGFLLGVGYMQRYSDDVEGIRVSGGIRYKRLYLNVGVSSYGIGDYGVQFEF